MAETTIEWTWRPRPDGTLIPGYTFNPWIGCSKVHAGCAHCYAELQFDSRRHVAEWGPHGTRVVTSIDNWKKPLKWNRDAAAADERRIVFCASLADVFESYDGPIQHHRGHRLGIGRVRGVEVTFPAVYGVYELRHGERWATLNDIRRRLWDLIDATPNLDWLLLTKRPKHVRHMWGVRACQDCTGMVGSGNCPTCGRKGPEEYRPNVWLGTSVSDQSSADEQIPELLKCRDLSPVLFLSCEPLLGPIDLTAIGSSLPNCHPFLDCLNGKESPGPYLRNSKVDWVIAGGESGLNARPCHPDWIRGLRDQCEAAVPFFFKQWGEWRSTSIDPQTAKLPGALNYLRGAIEKVVEFSKVGKAKAGFTLDGCAHREFPKVTA